MRRLTESSTIRTAERPKRCAKGSSPLRPRRCRMPAPVGPFLYLVCPGASQLAPGVAQGEACILWPGVSGGPLGPPFADGGESVGDDDGEFAGDDEGPGLVPPLARLWLPLDPPASLIPLAALLNRLVVAPLRASTATTMLPTSRSKRTAYSGADTPVSSLPICRNIPVPEPPITRSARVIVPGFGGGHARLRLSR